MQTISDIDAATGASDLERHLVDWALGAVQRDFWRYTEIEVNDNEHVWDGRLFAYSGHPAPQVWNTWRCLRIMLSRTQETICRKLRTSYECDEQVSYFRKTRRQMADEICATIPAWLGHAAPAFNSSCVLITASGCLWPLYLAGTCTLERVGCGMWSRFSDSPVPPDVALHSTAYVQSTWIIGRFEHISQHMGLKWADSIASPLARRISHT